MLPPYLDIDAFIFGRELELLVLGNRVKLFVSNGNASILECLEASIIERVNLAVLFNDADCWNGRWIDFASFQIGGQLTNVASFFESALDAVLAEAN